MLEILFSISLVVIILLLSLKVVENSRGRRIFVFEALSRFDSPIKSKIDQGKDFLNQSHSKVTRFAQEELPQHTKNMVFAAKSAAKEKYDTILPNVRGNRVLQGNGKVSEFLKDIAKHKEENGGGRIEE